MTANVEGNEASLQTRCSPFSPPPRAAVATFPCRPLERQPGQQGSVGWLEAQGAPGLCGSGCSHSWWGELRLRLSPNPASVEGRSRVGRAEGPGSRGDSENCPGPPCPAGTGESVKERWGRWVSRASTWARSPSCTRHSPGRWLREPGSRAGDPELRFLVLRAGPPALPTLQRPHCAEPPPEAVALPPACAHAHLYGTAVPRPEGKLDPCGHPLRRSPVTTPRPAYGDCPGSVQVPSPAGLQLEGQETRCPLSSKQLRTGLPPKMRSRCASSPALESPEWRAGCAPTGTAGNLGPGRASSMPKVTQHGCRAGHWHQALCGAGSLQAAPALPQGTRPSLLACGLPREPDPNSGTGRRTAPWKGRPH